MLNPFFTVYLNRKKVKKSKFLSAMMTPTIVYDKQVKSYGRRQG